MEAFFQIALFHSSHRHIILLFGLMATLAPAATTLCDECEIPAMQLCEGCRASWYCSKECQKLAWITHKHLCKTFGNFRVQDRPPPADRNRIYTRAVLFDPAKSHPEFVWLVTRQNDTFINLDDFSDKGALSDATKSKLTDAHVCDQRLHFSHNELLDRRLDHNI
jgi:hypothetical protein